VEVLFYRLTYASLIVMGVGCFTSVSFSAIGHILLLPPALYFSLRAIRQKTFFKISKSSWCLWGVVASIILSLLLNWQDVASPIRNLSKIKYFILPLLGIHAYREMFDHWINRKKIVVLLWLVIIATSLASLSGLVGLYTGFNPLKFKEACHPDRSCGLFGMYMTYGYGISMYCVLAVVAFFRLGYWSKFTGRGAVFLNALINGVGLVASFSRGAWLGSFVGVASYLFKVNKKYFLSLLAVGLIGVVGAYFTIPKVQKMISSPARKSSSEMRMGLYKAAFYGFKESPFFGKGYRNFEPQSRSLKIKYNLEHPDFQGHAHNNFIEHLVSTGGVGFVFILFFHFFWLLEMYGRKDEVGFLVFPFVVSFIVSGMFQYTFGDGENVFFIMSIYALSQLRVNKRFCE